jgi:hypothetical protein
MFVCFYLCIFSNKLDLFEATCFITVAQELTLTAELMNANWGPTNIRLGLKMEINQCPKSFIVYAPGYVLIKPHTKNFQPKLLWLKLIGKIWR